MYTLNGLAGHLNPPDGEPHDPYYVGSTNPKDPVLSPIYADLHGMPPALFITSGRDALLSSTTNLHRAYLRAGVDARLVVFDGLPHAFWYHPEMPESIEANHIMAKFFVEHLAEVVCRASFELTVDLLSESERQFDQGVVENLSMRPLEEIVDARLRDAAVLTAVACGPAVLAVMIASIWTVIRTERASRFAASSSGEKPSASASESKRFGYKRFFMSLSCQQLTRDEAP